MNSLSKKTLLLQGKTYAENQAITNGYIKIVNGKIIEIGPLTHLSNQSDFQVIKLPDGFTNDTWDD
jgi:N-acetylglucosamine-6-phosphate deacetylase